MQISSKRLEKTAVLLTQPISYILALIFVWLLTIIFPHTIRTLYMSGLSTGEPISIYAIALQFIVGAFGLAFVISILIQVGVISKKKIMNTWDNNTPPYFRKSEKDKNLPYHISQNEYAANMKKAKFTTWFIKIGILVYLAEFLYFRFFFFQAAVQFSSLPNPPLGLIGAGVTYLTSVPIISVSLEKVATMNNASLYTNAALVWIPAIPLTVGYINLQSYLHRIIRKELFLLFTSDSVDQST